MNRHLYFIKLACNEFKVHRKRLLLTAVALAWGTFTIMVLLAFGEGLKRQFFISSKGIGENLVILWGGQTSVPYNGLPTGRVIRFKPEDINYLRQNIPEIRGISGEYSQHGVEATVGRNSRSILVVGTSSDFGEMRNQIPTWGSRFLHPIDIKEKKRVVFMGWEAAEKFFPNQDATGKIITINKIPFKIIGVLKEKKQSSNYNNMDSQKCYIPETTFRALFGSYEYSNIVYSLYNPNLNKYVENRIYQLLGKKYQFDPNDKMSLSFWDVIEMHDISGKVMTGLQIFMGIMGFLTLLISAVGLANIMYVSVKLRSKEIGVKIALGAHPKQILRQIISETFLFSLIGGGFGALMGFIIVHTVRNIPTQNEAIEILSKPSLPIEITLIVMVILSTVTFFAGYFPAKKASRQNPIQSLRYE